MFLEKIKQPHQQIWNEKARGSGMSTHLQGQIYRRKYWVAIYESAVHVGPLRAGGTVV